MRIGCAFVPTRRRLALQPPPARPKMALLGIALLLLVGVSAAFEQHDAATSRYVRNSYFVEVDASSSALSKRGLTPFAVRPSPLLLVQPAAWRRSLR